MKRAFALLLASTMLIMGACATNNTTTKSNLKSDSMRIKRGMDYDSVLDIAAPYVKERTFKGRGTALQVCEDTGSQWVDGVRAFYVVVWMVDDVVEGLTQYQERTGKCERHFREVDWGQAPADVKIKLDID